MDWSRSIDGYCERLGPGLWAEPWTAASNLAFGLAALWMWRRCAGMPAGRVLCAILFAIGVGSALFHTVATVAASLADMLPIAAFVVVYVHAANRHFWGWPAGAAALGAAGVVPWTAALTPVFAAMPGFSVSAVYWPVPCLIALYAVLLRRRAPATARGLGGGAALLCLSLVFRTLDLPLCAALPVGTHMVWHVLNALMLAWMIEVLRRHQARADLEASRAGR